MKYKKGDWVLLYIPGKNGYIETEATIEKVEEHTRTYKITTHQSGRYFIVGEDQIIRKVK